jgi:hypothetical protein
MKYITCADTAKLVRAAVKEVFPKIKFGVKSKTYSGGASITISWIDGPTSAQVNAVTSRFSGADFDPMQDLKTNRTSELNGEKVSFGADYIFTQRQISARHLRDAILDVCFKFGIDDIPMVTETGHGVRFSAQFPVCKNAVQSFEEVAYQTAREMAA